MKIQKMKESDFEEFWPIFKEIVEAEETFAFDADISFNDALNLWLYSSEAAYVARENGILGSYYIKKNASGPSAHISNCGYMVSPDSRGKGVARAMCIHSQKQAIALGFSAIQFNSIVSTNIIATELWKKLGFKIIGTIPKGYNHKKHGFVDTYIMHKELRA